MPHCGNGGTGDDNRNGTERHPTEPDGKARARHGGHTPRRGNFVGWRLLGDEGENVTFDVIRDGQTIARDVYATNYNDAGGEAGAVYEIVKRPAARPERHQSRPQHGARSTRL